ncbi:MAG: alpha/beta hydrolase [Arenimonas sp.]
MNRPGPRGLLAAAAALLLAGCQHVYFGALNLGAGEGTAELFAPGHGLKLDVYKPSSPAPGAPVVVFFYGGSWTSGSRDYYRFVGKALAERGVLVLIPDYRKAPEHPFPAFMQDGADAVAWAHAHAASLGGDPNRIFLMGHSAGAQIAALLATDARYLAVHQMRPTELAGVIGLAGPYDFLPLVEPAVMQALGPREGWPQTQPINFVSGDEPPFLLIQGDADTRVDPGNTPRFAASLRAHAQQVAVVTVPGVGHVGLVNGFYSRRFSPVLLDSLDWMHGAKRAPPGG